MAEQSTRTWYDAYGQVARVAAPGTPDASATIFTYEPDGDISSTRDAAGVTTRYVHDALGNVVSKLTSTTSGTATETSVYDVGGRLVTLIDADGVRTDHVYDLAGREISAAGSGEGAGSSRAVYNVLGWPVLSVKADETTTSVGYDTQGRATTTIVAAAGASAQTTRASYDAAGHLIQTIDATGRRSVTSFDAFGRATAQSLLASDGARVSTTTVAYDTLSRPTDRVTERPGVLPLADHITYPVPTRHSVIVASTVNGVTTTSDVNSRGFESSRLASWGSGSLSRVVEGRDAAARETAFTLSGKTFTRTFDAAGRLTAYSAPGLSTSRALTYDLNGNRATESIATSLGVAIETAFAYTDAGRLKAYRGTWMSATSTVAFDNAGNLTTQTAEPVSGQTVALAYAPKTFRLLSRKVGASVVSTYTFDARGERIAAGPTTNKTQTVYAYDEAGHLASVATSSGPRASYTYDALGSRTRSVVTSGSAVTTTTWTYAGTSLLDLSAESSGTTYSVTYLRDLSGRPYAGLYRKGGSEATSVAFLLSVTDHGDVIGLTDTSGTPFASYRYDPFGVITSSASTKTASVSATLAAEMASRQVLRYAGYVWDATSGTYHLSAREYDPLTRSFLTKDPAVADGEGSPYQYCGGDPVGRVDPSGLRAMYTIEGNTRADALAYASEHGPRHLRNTFRRQAQAEMQKLARQREAQAKRVTERRASEAAKAEQARALQSRVQDISSIASGAAAVAETLVILGVGATVLPWVAGALSLTAAAAGIAYIGTTVYRRTVDSDYGDASCVRDAALGAFSVVMTGTGWAVGRLAGWSALRGSASAVGAADEVATVSEEVFGAMATVVGGVSDWAGRAAK